MPDSILPANATPQERALGTVVERVSAVPKPARQMWSPQDCPADLLPWLAWAFSVDEWESSWTEEQKRGAIAASYVVHRRKGTVGAVKRALAAIGLNARIVEWFRESVPGDPYTFRIAVDSGATGATREQLDRLVRMISATKNLRSHLREIAIEIVSSSGIHVAAASTIGNEINIMWHDVLRLDGTWRLDGTQMLDGIKR